MLREKLDQTERNVESFLSDMGLLID